MSPPRIVLFATPACPHCASARRVLEAYGEPFEERDPSGDPLALRDLLFWSPSAAVPTVVVGGRVLIGFDPDHLELLLSSEPEEEEPEVEPPADEDDDPEGES